MEKPRFRVRTSSSADFYPYRVIIRGRCIAKFESGADANLFAEMMNAKKDNLTNDD